MTGEPGGRVMTRDELAKMIDHTLLAPEATEADVQALCAEGRELGVGAVCVSASLVTCAVDAVAGSGIAVAAVVGFPSGAHATAVKALEAQIAAEQGVDELDMVVNLGWVLQGRWDDVGADIRGVRDAAPRPVVCKVIVESGRLSAAQIARACEVAEAAGADYVKTSTGFHPSGGATLDAVAIMAQTVAPRLGVKASGGIRTTKQALALIAAGATRLGLSKSAAILAGLDASADPPPSRLPALP